jgi:endonuclease/exonuclease/phosphatase family metal-dependent hydrolase
MLEHYVAWWNLENLFETSSFSERSERLRSALRRELVGWTSAVLARKIAQLASIIVQMNGARGPDILGVCEVENETVLQRLVDALAPLGRNYRIMHHDSGDGRGIDVAFIYDATRFDAEQDFHHVVLRRNNTRDLYQVNFRTPEGRLLSIVANHWPARSAGRLASEPYRIIAAETLSYWLARIQEIHGKNAYILVMGDFNDEPWDRSMVDYALSSVSRTKTNRARSPRLWNLMWPIAGVGIGSHYFNNFPNLLDQVLVTRGLARTTSEFLVEPDSAEVVRFPEMISGGLYPAPRRFGRPSRSSTFDRDGYSDHYPVAVMLRERT